MKIVIDHKIPYIQGVLEPFAEVIYADGKDISAEMVKEADALIIRTRTKCDAALLDGSTVKMIASATIGFDHIDTNYCEENGITWTNAPGCNSGSVMQYVAASLSYLSNKHGFSLADKTIGIVGLGNVGSKVAKMASAFGMNVLLNDPPRERKEGKSEFVSLQEIQRKADIISFHVPLNKEGIDKTANLFDQDFLAQIKEDVIIINTCRGEVVSGEVLKSGLSSKKVKAAVIDVWENEPNIDEELLKLVNIGTPHIAGYSADGKANGTAMSVASLARKFKLDIPNWFPNDVPKATNIYFDLDCKDLTKQDILKKAILHTYDITMDSQKLKTSVHTFEEQRGNYPLRREFYAYQPRFTNAANEMLDALKKLGFE